jgi:hypothetical protein
MFENSDSAEPAIPAADEQPDAYEGVPLGVEAAWPLAANGEDQA